MIKRNIGVIIQARTSSTRFPNKIIIPFDEDTTFLDILLSRIKLLESKLPIILATTTNKSDIVLENYAKKYNLPVFFGSEQNVLERFLDSAKKFDLEYIVRVCSDNPFIDLNLISELLDVFDGEDYLAYEIDEKPSILTHSGFFSEIVSVKALKKVYESNNLNCQEHVTNCIYTHPKDFVVKFINKEVSNSVRCTLDTEKDFNNLKFIYFNWYKKIKNKNFDYTELVKYLKSNKKLLQEMQTEIINNIK
ncbi:cytidylyltransferase domain-containing protein [Hwangdonia lutea]|uniref:Uncharacterized protein n=1 Tax=Hwangdonia lutea TaxID=3075823 RepID=A0AA97HSM9_9FLAO|nr:hypothetical protein [Hwangdonia sp. SCSIO 19198]WOD45043.1 hypothetical protein RNZ46_07190 [Hwangdonia sp. SCSIO 19198]